MKATDVATKPLANEVSTSPMVKSFSMVPQTLADAMQLAKMIAESDLAPKDYKGKPGNVLIAMQMGAEIGIPALQAIQNIAVINGRPSIYGDLGKAMLLAGGCRIEERDMKEIKVTGEGWCKITRPDGSEPTIRTFSIENAKEAGLWGKAGPWTSTPYRMLAWRAFWFSARDAAADMLKGLSGAEEVRDYAESSIVSDEPIAIPQTKAETEVSVPAAPPSPVAPAAAPAPAAIAAEPPNASVLKKMTSRFPGECESCGEEIAKGSEIFYDASRKVAYHSNCITTGN
jgi:hypothetical protein